MIPRPADRDTTTTGSARPADPDTTTTRAVVPARHSADLMTDRASHAVPHARGHLGHVLRSWRVPTPLVQDAELLVSELATNAVSHGSGPTLRIRTEQWNHVLRCQIHDDGPPGTAPPATSAPRSSSLPVPAPENTALDPAGSPLDHAALPDLDALPEAGRGLALVDALATRWGSYTDPALPGGRHVVWFEIACPETDTSILHRVVVGLRRGSSSS